MQPVFTRYLYEKRQVMLSLRNAMLAKKREESLFWAYELYYSGFTDEVWKLVYDIYQRNYERMNPAFKRRLDELREIGDAVSLGTVVGTLAVRSTETKHNERIVLVYKINRHETIAPCKPPRKYLAMVSSYPVRLTVEDASSHIGTIVDTSFLANAYLGVDWLYYCSQTPIWVKRISEFGGAIVDEDKCVAFNSDEDLEAFYEMWGLEPDEQSIEMHLMHGIHAAK